MLRRSRALRSLRFAARFSVLARQLGRLLVALGVLTCVPGVVAWATGDPGVALRTFAAAAALAVPGAFGWRLGRRANLQRNEALVLTGLVFALTSLAGAIPLTGYGLTPLDAWFEATSGATTTGLSVLASVDGAPAGLLFFRAWLQWIGGLGVLVLALALLITPGASARRMGFDAREVADVAGGTRAHARRVVVIYATLTLLGIAALVAVGVGAGDAVCHAFTAVSTGGFGTHPDSLATFSGGARAVVMALCFAGAVPFSFYYLTRYQQPRRILSDPRLLSLVILCGLTALALGATRRFAVGGSGPMGIADVVTTAVSAQTTAGFSTARISDLAPASKLVVIVAMFVGGGVGSTAGGVKVFRLLVCLRILGLLLDRVSILPSGRLRLRLAGSDVSSDEVEGIVGVLLAYVVLVAVSWLAFLAYGYDPLDCLFEVVSAVGTVGLSTGITNAGLPSLLKGVLSLDMLMGRVEVVAVLVLFLPTTWIGRRRRI